MTRLYKCLIAFRVDHTTVTSTEMLVAVQLSSSLVTAAALAAAHTSVLVHVGLLLMCALQGDLSRKEWVAPALSPLTEGAGTTGGTGSTGGGIQQTIHNAVEATKDYLPAQVTLPKASQMSRVLGAFQWPGYYISGVHGGASTMASFTSGTLPCIACDVLSLLGRGMCTLFSPMQIANAHEVAGLSQHESFLASIYTRPESISMEGVSTATLRACCPFMSWCTTLFWHCAPRCERTEQLENTGQDLPAGGRWS